VTCRANGCRYSFFEEKKTDVNIAVHMLSDAFAGTYDKMFVVSADSDIQPAVEWVVKNTAVRVTVYIPALPQEQANRRTDYYKTKGIPVACKFLPLGNIKDHQLPNIVHLPGGRLVARPHTWTKSNLPPLSP
jgi:hypothetical protein